MGISIVQAQFWNTMTQGSGFELIQHSGDCGVLLKAASLEELMEIAAQALYASLGQLKLSRSCKRTLELELQAADRPALLRDFLAELLFYFQNKQLLAKSVSVKEFSEVQLRVSLELFEVELGQSELFSEIKAVTYHQLALEEIKDNFGKTSYQAKVIFDL